MFCKNCGKEFSSSNGNCPFCGTPNVNAMNGGFDGNGGAPVQEFNLISAYTEMFKKYATFSGRSSRSEYWYVVLANVIIGFIAGLLSSILPFFTVILYIYEIAIIAPTLALTVRRLHDSGKNGWMILLGLIPLAGGIIILVFTLLDSQPGTNQYGPNPKGL